MLRNTGNTDAYIIEYGFLDSTKDDVSQLKNNWQELTEAAVEAIAQYLGLPYDNPVSNIYTVRSGDTLWSIAKKNNVTVDELKKINNLTNNLLSIGQILTILPSIQDRYIVKPGDTLWSIASKYNTTVAELRSLNNLSTDVLSIGQIVSVPSTSQQSYTVKSGDTLWNIANRYNVTVSDIKKINNLSNSLLKIGQVLILPNK